MSYLLDTHTFLWMAGDPLSLSEKVREIVEDKNNPLYLSAASAWEIAMLQQLKRLELPGCTATLHSRSIATAQYLADSHRVHHSYIRCNPSVHSP